MTTSCNISSPMTQQEGYTKAPHSILRDPSLSPAAKVAWLLIAGMSDGYHPTREQWMAMMPCGDKRTWWKVIRELENAGLVEVTRQGPKKCYKAIFNGVKQHQTKGVKPHRKRVQNNTERGCETTPKERCEITPYKKNIIEEQEKRRCARTLARGSDPGHDGRDGVPLGGHRPGALQHPVPGDLQRLGVPEHPGQRVDKGALPQRAAHQGARTQQTTAI